MNTQSFKGAVATALVALLLAGPMVSAQEQETLLKITRPQSAKKLSVRETPAARLGREQAFARIGPELAAAQKPAPGKEAGKQRRFRTSRADALARVRTSAAAPGIQSFGTGGGDINEIEPNDTVSQGVSLPVNVFGRISFNTDVDFFAFQALAGQPIVIEPFAFRLPDSDLIADIALFDTSGRMLARDVGGEDFDPLIRFVPANDEVLIVGITDPDDLGGFDFDYILNITRGVDVEEDEPNDRVAQALPRLPATVFGDIENRDDVDFYSFAAEAGQTLIVDVDAEVLGSRLDSEINLIDRQTGDELFYNDQYDGDDSRFNIVLPRTGTYVIGIGGFNGNSRGFYRLNASLVPGAGAPIISSVVKLSKKLVEITGSGFTARTVVEVNGIERKTTVLNSGTLRAKVKARAGDVVTVSNLPDERRSNPIILE